MRLLDAIAQASTPFLLDAPDGRRHCLPAAADLAPLLRSCPVRYVLADDLLRECIELAYAGGDELCSCLDLARVPAEALWVEWSEPVRLESLARLGATPPQADAGTVARAGVLVHSAHDGRSARLRTAWSEGTAGGQPTLSPLETLLDFDHPPARSMRPLDLLAGQVIGVGQDTQLGPLLECAGIRLLPGWREYYAAAARTTEAREQVLRMALAVAAFDVPILCALFLLLSVRAQLRVTACDRAAINAKRARRHHPPLLAHAELSLPMARAGAPAEAAADGDARQSPRMHHVRGHLVRRRDALFWRRPHWRGHIRLGTAPARTVQWRSGTEGLPGKALAAARALLGEAGTGAAP